MVYIHVLANVYYILSHLDNTSLCVDYPAETFKTTVTLFGPMLQNLKDH